MEEFVTMLGTPLEELLPDEVDEVEVDELPVVAIDEGTNLMREDTIFSRLPCTK
jgi:hypothetical protein